MLNPGPAQSGLCSSCPPQQRSLARAIAPIQTKASRQGCGILSTLDKLWGKYVADKDERLKFVLSSYNAGLSHIIDARNLAKKYGKNPAKWEEVEVFLKQKSNPKYYRDPVVVAGYCKCEEPVNYVREILNRYEEYKILIAEV